MEAHPEVVNQIPELVATLPAQRGNTRVVLQNERFRVVISEDFHGQQKRWIVTALEKGDPDVQTSRREHLALDGSSTDAGRADNIAGAAPAAKGAVWNR